MARGRKRMVCTKVKGSRERTNLASQQQLGSTEYGNSENEP